MKDNYIPDFSKSETLKFHYEITITNIVLVPTKLQEKKHWEFKVKESNEYGITHTTVYFSKNLLALEQQRNKILQEYSKVNERIYKPSSHEGKYIRPNILERILADKDEKIK